MVSFLYLIKGTYTPISNHDVWCIMIDDGYVCEVPLLSIENKPSHTCFESVWNVVVAAPTKGGC